MSILVFAENIEGKFSKSAFEVLTYGADLARQTGDSLFALVTGNVGDDELRKLSVHGAQKIIHAGESRLADFSLIAYAKIVDEVAKANNVTVLVMSSTFNGKTLGARLSARWKAGMISNAVSIPLTDKGFTVKKPVYSGKGFANFEITSPIKIITVGINGYHISKNEVEHSVESIQPQLTDSD
nr:electron transfer flavoprotein subunit alpha/FixB family protein [Bacteroidota bacterium]